jgi:four helix bundle protein
MFLKLNHQNLDIYQVSKQFTIHCYRFTKQLPADEKFGMTSQIRRAALSTHLNIAEGCSRKSSLERKRYYEVARGSVIEIDAALDIAQDLDYFSTYDPTELGNTMIRCFQLLSKMISANESNSSHS